MQSNMRRTDLTPAKAVVGKRRVGFLVFDGFKLLDVSGPAEAFNDANQFGANYELEFFSPDGSGAVSSLGLPVSVKGNACDAAPLDTVIVSGGDLLPHGFIGQNIVDAAADLAGRSRRVASVCTGAFILADAGLLDGRRATTHWQHAAQLRLRYRKITVESDAIFVKDGAVFTSAGVTAGIDLALALIEEDHGAELARKVAKSLVMYLQRSGGQSQFSIPLQGPAPVSAPLRRVVEVMRRDPASPHTVVEMAKYAHLSTRQLSRLFRDEMNTTPRKFLDSVRFETACSLLDAGHTISDVAERSGFGSLESLRRSFITNIGVPPSKYQHNFLTSSIGHVPAGAMSESEG